MNAPCWYDSDTELISVSFRFDPEFIKDCQRIPGRRWDGFNKLNTFPLDSAPEVKILTTKWGIKVDDGLKQRPQWDATPAPEHQYNVSVDGKWVAMYFPYRQEIIDSIHDTIPGASWDDPHRRWQTSVINANDAVLFAEQWGLTVEPTLAAEAHKYIELANHNHRISGLIESEPFPIPGLVGELRPYQYSCVEYSVRNNRVIIADSPGLGKSLESLSVMMMKGSLPCVIVCKAKLKYTLRDEVWKWFPGSTAMVLSGTEVFPIPDVDFIILNGDMLQITLAPPTVSPPLIPPTPLVASGFSTVNGMAVCLVGDGSFNLVMNIMPLAAEHRLGVTWCVLDDRALGSIRDIQQTYFNGRYLGTEFACHTDFAAVAAACGCYGERVEDPEAVDAALDRAMAANREGRPAVLDFIVAPERLPASVEFFAR